MILIDLQQTAMAHYIMDAKDRSLPEKMIVENGFGDEDKPDIDRLRNGLLRSLRAVRRKFSEQYGELVLCCDSQLSWRRDIFPLYKARRRKSRDESVLDWKNFNTIFTTIKAEFRDNMPYYLIEADGAEGDDVIAVMCEWNANKRNKEPILIYSSDQDFLQLQRFPEVSQYDKFRDRFLKCENPEYELRELIIRGDVDDGVPNIFSEDNCFVAGIRQRPVMTAKVEIWKTLEPAMITDWDDDTRSRWERNRSLVDLSAIPANIKAHIAQTYLDLSPAGRGNVYKYLMQVGATELIAAAGEF